MTDTSLNGYSSYIAPNQGDAWAYLQSILSYYGLSSLNDFAHNAIVQGLSNDQVVQGIRQTDAYKTTFKPILDRQAQGLPAISENDVLSLRSQYAAIDKQMGAPEGFNGTQDYDQYIVNDMSPTEYQDRWIKGYQAVADSDPAVKQAAANYYGATDGHLAAYFLDPTKTVDMIEKQAATAQIGGAATSAGFSGLTKDQAEYLQSLGVTQQQASQGFTDLSAKSQLFNLLPGEQGTGVSADEQLSAEFAGNGAEQQKIKDIGAQRVGDLAQGGQFAQNKEGFGLGATK